VVLTERQCEQYRLPRTPIKEGDRRIDRFEEQHGEGAVELDALEALHPGELADILQQEIDRFHDGSLNARTRAAAGPIHRELARVTAAVHEQHRKEIDD
jgi:hypothetical protein